MFHMRTSSYMSVHHMTVKEKKVNKVYARSIDNVDFFPIGTYNNSEDAMDVMDQIRNCYSGGREYCYMPTEGEMLMMERNK